jgi:hypothetical protein
MVRTSAFGLGAIAVLGATVGVGATQSNALRDAIMNPAAHVHTAPPLTVAAAPAIKTDNRHALALAANNAARELAGSGDSSSAAWDPASGLWDRQKRPAAAPPGWSPPIWWQSGLALRALIRYLERTHNTQPVYQRLISATFSLNYHPSGLTGPRGHRFANRFMDDTGWWGLAWLEAARYELMDRHDVAAASKYLQAAEWVAKFMYALPRPCGGQGIEWKIGHPPNTITNAEFISLAAELAQARSAPGPLQDRAKAAVSLSMATQTLSRLERSRLINTRTGFVWGGFSRSCRRSGGPLTYMEGEVADALVQVGTAESDPSYYHQAAVFINRVLQPWNGWLVRGVLRERCEGRRRLCTSYSYNITVYKGLFDDAVSDWTRATRATTYVPFLLAQAHAVMAEGASNGRHRTACRTPGSCQIGLYWSRLVNPRRAPIPITPGTQTSGLTALTNALAVRPYSLYVGRRGRRSTAVSSSRHRQPAPRAHRGASQFFAA